VKATNNEGDVMPAATSSGVRGRAEPRTATSLRETAERFDLQPWLPVQRTPAALARWAEAAAKLVRATITGQHVCAALRPFRWGGHDILELQFYDELDNFHTLEFKLGCVHNFHPHEPGVPDAIDALHMVGLIIRRLQASSVSIGDHDASEVNCFGAEGRLP